MKRVAIVGAGRMGSHHARIVAAHPELSIATVVDTDVRRAEALGERYGVTWSNDPGAALGADVAIVATPPTKRAEVVLPLLDAGVPALVEKPVSVDLSEAERIVVASRRNGVPIACGFVERYNPAFTTVRRALADAGPAIHVLAVRHSPPDRRMLVGVVGDLLIHDIDLALQLTEAGGAGAVRASGWIDPARGVLEVADATFAAAGALVTLSASRASQRKMRTLQVSTATALLEADLLRRTVTVWRHVAHDVEGGDYRAQTTMDLPFVHEHGEPLALQLDRFVALARGEADPEPERASILPAHRIAAAVEEQVAATGTPAGSAAHAIAS